ncbi:MAG: 3'-5' exonuclease [Magnetococcales bacterium]|nr:3'-5' exonuclease [Magnetococcales bacterium]
MFKNIKKQLWAFDAEWIPDPHSGRILYQLADSLTDAEVMEEMWQRGGATEENPTPYLKTVQCRLVSIAMVQRQIHDNGQITLRLLSLPRSLDGKEGEREILQTFLGALGDRQPQLVGYNSLAADIRIMVQRGITQGITAPRFARRPNKPWEGVDYFARGGDWHIDLKDYAAPGWGSGTPSLHEMAVLSGIPGKMETDGQQVPKLWLEDRLDKIVAYNEFDALTTYLVWMRMAHFTGLITPDQYQQEQQLTRALIVKESKAKPYLSDFLDEWDRLIEAWKKAVN